LAHPFSQFECHWFFTIAALQDMVLIFSSLVVDPLPDKSVTFLVSSGAKPSTEA
jgi:hypothetical protein